MAALQSREKTFDTPLWISENHKATNKEFAESGLFFLNRKDQVQCFFCEVVLNDWKYSDSPMVEHLKHAPTCTFILTRMGLTKELSQKSGMKESRSSKQAFTPQVVSGLNKPQLPPNEAIIAIPKESNDEIDFPATTQGNINEIVFQVQNMGFDVVEIKHAITQNWLNGRLKMNSVQQLVESILDNKWYNNKDKQECLRLNITNQDEFYEKSRNHQTILINHTCEWCEKEDIQMLFLPCQCWRFCRTCATNII